MRSSCRCDRCPAGPICPVSRVCEPRDSGLAVRRPAGAATTAGAPPGARDWPCPLVPEPRLGAPPARAHSLPGWLPACLSWNRDTSARSRSANPPSSSAVLANCFALGTRLPAPRYWTCPMALLICASDLACSSLRRGDLGHEVLDLDDIGDDLTQGPHRSHR